MANLDRRTFLNRAAITGGAALAMQSFIARGALAAASRSLASKRDGGYGRLRPTPTENTGEVLLALPEGFTYTIFGRTGTPMSDGKLTPPAHDGMAAFDDVNGMIRLVRNHEVG